MKQRDVIIALDLTKAAINLRSTTYSHRSNQLSQNSNPYAETYYNIQTSFISHRQNYSTINISDQKAAVIMIRNIIKSIISKYFKRMLQRLMFKKIAYKLITSKRRRDIQFGFLAIRNYCLKLQNSIIINHLQRHIDFKILNSILKRITKFKLDDAFGIVKGLANRQKHQAIFINILYDSIGRAVKKICYLLFINELKTIIQVDQLRQLHLSATLKINKKVTDRFSTLAIDAMFNYGLFNILQDQLSLKKEKAQNLKFMGCNTKQKCGQMRQKIKQIKVLIDHQKLNRTKSFNQKKKYNNTSRIVEIQVNRKFQKQFKVQNSLALQIENQCQIMESKLSKRRINSTISQQWKIKCMDIFKKLSQNQAIQIKKVYKLYPHVQNQVWECQNTQHYIFRQNAKYLKLVDIYEKKEPGNYQAEYYSLDHENYVIKELIRCFIQEQYDSYLFSQKHKEQIAIKKSMVDEQNDETASS